jgi:hypothetical protein
MPSRKQVYKQYEDYVRSLGDYTPVYDFAAAEDTSGEGSGPTTLYGYGYQAPSRHDERGITSQALNTGQVPGAFSIPNPETIADPTVKRDYDIWRRKLDILAQLKDPQSLISNEFILAAAAVGGAAGLAGAFGGFAAAPALGEAGVAGAGALGADATAPITLQAGANIAATPTLTAPSSSGLFGSGVSLKSALGYLSTAKSAAQFAQDPSLENALKAVGSAVGAGPMNFADYASLATALAGAGASAYGAVNGMKATADQNDIANQQSQLAQQLFAEGAPLRGLSNAQLLAYLAGGGVPPSVTMSAPNTYGLDTFMQSGELPVALQPSPLPSVPDLTAANRGVLESQFTNARNRTIEGADARGGQLNTALADLEAKRAAGVTDLYSRQNALGFEQATNERNRQNALTQQLFGVGLDVEREQAQRQDALKRALFSTAIGAGNQNVGPALQGLSGASSGFGNVASTALSGVDAGTDFLGHGLAAYFRNQQKPGSDTPFVPTNVYTRKPTNMGYDY